MTNEEAIKRLKQAMNSMAGEFVECWFKKEHLQLAIDAMEKQIPKKPYIDNENGVYEKEYCPTCHRSLFPNDHHCRCGQRLDWGENGNECIEQSDNHA